MSSPVPVPSKAAIRALRGLALGTTCSLVLVVEDRRRRINAAQAAISNSKKIKSCRQYRTGGASTAIASKEEEALVAGSWPFPHRHPHFDDRDETYHPGQTRPQRLRPSDGAVTEKPAAPLGAQPAADSVSTPAQVGPRGRFLPELPLTTQALPDPLLPTQTPPRTFTKQTWIRRIRRMPVKVPERPKPPEEPMPATVDRNIARVEELLASDQPSSLVEAAQLLMHTLRLPKELVMPHKEKLLDVSASVSKASQRAEEIDLAKNLVVLVVGRMEPDEEAYFALDPLPLVKAAMRPQTAQFSVAQPLFLPFTIEKPNLERAKEVLDIAACIINEAFARLQPKYVDRIMARVLPYLEGESGYHFLFQTFQQMHENGMARSVVRFFLAQDTRPLVCSRDQIFEMGDLVVSCMPPTNGARAGDVLERLLEIRPERFRLKATWVAELLYQDWRAHRKYSKTAGLFEKLYCSDVENMRSSGVGATVLHPDAAYRAMIQVSLEAGLVSNAKAYLDENLATQPSRASYDEAMSNMRIYGLFALERAKVGDWAEVEAILTNEMAKHSKVLGTRLGARIFVPILKVFSQRNGVDETAEFLSSHLERLKIPLVKEMVTLMADRYGKTRRFPEFLAWLEFCASHRSRDFQLDAAFSNAILQGCMRHWSFSFVELREVHSKLKGLGAELSDDVTENIMTCTALGKPATTADRINNRLRHVETSLSLTLPEKVARQVRKEEPVLQNDVHQSMMLSIGLCQYELAISTYDGALAEQMPHCEKCLRLYCIAHVELDRADWTRAEDMLLRAHHAGVYVGDALTPLFMSQLEHLDPEKSAEQTERHIQALLGHATQLFGKFGLRVHSRLLNKAAAVCLARGIYRSAVTLAIQAAEEVGQSPGYSSLNFQILADSFMALGRLDRLATLIQHMTDRGGWDDMALQHKNVMAFLRQWLRRLRDADEDLVAAGKNENGSVEGGGAGQRGGEMRADAQQQMKIALETLRTARFRLREEQSMVRHGAVKIVTDAVSEDRHAAAGSPMNMSSITLPGGEEPKEAPQELLPSDGWKSVSEAGSAS